MSKDKICFPTGCYFIGQSSTVVISKAVMNTTKNDKINHSISNIINFNGYKAPNLDLVTVERLTDKCAIHFFELRKINK